MRGGSDRHRSQNGRDWLRAPKTRRSGIKVIRGENSGGEGVRSEQGVVYRILTWMRNQRPA